MGKFSEMDIELQGASPELRQYVGWLDTERSRLIKSALNPESRIPASQKMHLAVGLVSDLVARVKESEEDNRELLATLTDAHAKLYNIVNNPVTSKGIGNLFAGTQACMQRCASLIDDMKKGGDDASPQG